jgi:hypothetical protein
MGATLRLYPLFVMETNLVGLSFTELSKNTIKKDFCF